MKIIYAIDVSKYMVLKKNEIISLIEDREVEPDTGYVLFDTEVIDLTTVDYDDMFIYECAYYDCVSKILLQNKPVFPDSLQLYVYSSHKNTSGNMLTEDSFNYFVEHMTNNYDIEIIHMSTPRSYSHNVLVIMFSLLKKLFAPKNDTDFYGDDLE